MLDSDAFSSRDNVSSATLTIVVSRIDMIAPTITTVATARTSGDSRPSSVMRPSSSQPLDDLTQTAQQGAGGRPVLRLQRREDLGPPGVEAPALVVDRAAAVRRELDVDAAAVVLRALPAHEARALQRVEHAGGGWRGHARGHGELAGGARAVGQAERLEEVVLADAERLLARAQAGAGPARGAEEVLERAREVRRVLEPGRRGGGRPIRHSLAC